MKIRDKIQKKVVGTFLGIGLGLLFGFISTSNESSNIKLLFKVIAALCFAYAFILSNFFIKCPRCQGSLSHSQMRGQTKTNFCPTCGVSLDENI